MFQTMLKHKAEQDGKIYLEIGRFFPSLHLCNATLLPIPKMDLSVRSFLCPHCEKHHDRDVNAAMNIRDEGLRILALRTSATALGGNVRPKRYGRKSMTVEAIAVELGSPHSVARAMSVPRPPRRFR
jgi:putative transposase